LGGIAAILIGDLNDLALHTHHFLLISSFNNPDLCNPPHRCTLEISGPLVAGPTAVSHMQCAIAYNHADCLTCNGKYAVSATITRLVMQLRHVGISVFGRGHHMTSLFMSSDLEM